MQVERAECRTRWSEVAFEEFAKVCEPRGGVGVGSALRDEPGGVLLVVEGDDHVVPADGQRRQLELVDRRHGHALELRRELVAEHAGEPALERRQVGPGCLVAKPRGNPPQSPRAPRRIPPADRIGGDERVAAGRTAARRAVEKHDVRQVRQPAKHVDRHPSAGSSRSTRVMGADAVGRVGGTGEGCVSFYLGCRREAYRRR